MAFKTDIDDFHTNGREVYWLCKTGQGAVDVQQREHGADAEGPRHVPRHQHGGAAGREAWSHMIKSRTLDTITILDLNGPLGAGTGDAALRKAVRDAFEGGARTVILNMHDVPSIDSSGVAALASGHMTAANRGGHLKLCSLTQKLKDVFAIMRLDKVFESYDTEEHAIASVNPRVAQTLIPRRGGPSDRLDPRASSARRR